MGRSALCAGAVHHTSHRSGGSVGHHGHQCHRRGVVFCRDCPCLPLRRPVTGLPGGSRQELASSRFGSVLAGFTTLAAYAIVLYTIRAGTPASYAGAVREISVVFGAVIGVVFLHEKGSRVRVLGAITVVAGVVLIA